MIWTSPNMHSMWFLKTSSKVVWPASTLAWDVSYKCMRYAWHKMTWTLFTWHTQHILFWWCDQRINTAQCHGVHDVSRHQPYVLAGHYKRRVRHQANFSLLRSRSRLRRMKFAWCRKSNHWRGNALQICSISSSTIPEYARQLGDVVVFRVRTFLITCSENFLSMSDKAQDKDYMFSHVFQRKRREEVEFEKDDSSDPSSASFRYWAEIG